MSGSIDLPVTPFTDAERTDIRRFCGYPAYGPGASGFQSWRYFQAYGTLEYRLTNMAPAELQVVRQYLASLYTLESAVPAAGANLDTDVAAVWTHNKNEVTDRAKLYDRWRRQLVHFIGVPVGPQMPGCGRAIIV